uniref:Uncharacterized protein n=1 Tax=Tetradesmus obliquus TaxID=3088 RepID=A0A383VDI5_TETOB|eukprot:jgi/Sobl393_1/18108/SZX62714.1
MEQDPQLQAETWEALRIACQQPALIRCPKLLLTVAGTCKPLRQAAQQSLQCSGRHMDVVRPLNVPLPRLRSFAQWLPKTAALVKSLCTIAQNPAPERVEGLPWALHAEAAMLLLQQALQLAAAPAAAAGAAAAGSASAVAAAVAPVVLLQQQQQQQQQQGLRLDSFSGNWPGTPELLDALPAHSLTQLQLDLGCPSHCALTRYEADGTAASAALARFSSLQHLTVANTRYACDNPATCLAGVAQLTQVTYLDLAACTDHRWVGAPYGPPELPELRAVLPSLSQLRVLRLPAGAGVWPALDFSHMTQLQELTNADCALGDGNFFHEVQFPAQLRRLDFGAAAGMWAQLPQLRELTVGNEEVYVSREQWDAILTGLAAASSLTKLDLRLILRHRTEHDGQVQVRVEAAEACSALARLTSLKALRFHSILVPGDARELSALTGLTRLVLAGLGDGVGDAAAAALARSCCQLRHLDLSCCNVDSVACLAEIGRLTQLTGLGLHGNAVIAQQGLIQRIGLPQLQLLGVDRQIDMTG